MPVPNAVSRLLYLKASNKITLLLKPQIWQREICLAAISNLGIKPGVGYAWRGCRQQDRFLLLQNLHSRHPWRSSCRQVPMDGFTAFLDRHAPHPKPSENA